MTLLGGAVYAGFFALAALWLAATNPDAADDRVHANAGRQDLPNPVEPAAGCVGSPCGAGRS
ncbi:hypothetical protein MU0083_003578 [[Mycobacterium] kokjensenii]|uniref:Uncharacterized protein n=1 Tax=[Mycobacterium] kokjensenii TaxID=3064287 RepID=A0ABN9NEI3_9MYCO|nr:hypothetical protein [Mycolicibacter sp. MU0083]CAJ1504997.1 hypothetical protein MU0083_003578 [Mycolicibacter sp. MU0083]